MRDPAMIKLIVVLLCIGLTAYVFMIFSEKRQGTITKSTEIFATSLCNPKVIEKIEQRRTHLSESKPILDSARAEGANAPANLKAMADSSEKKLEEINKSIYRTMEPQFKKAHIEPKELLNTIRNNQFMETLLIKTKELCPKQANNNDAIGDLVTAVEAAIM
jgi:hypothetical protein